MQQDVRWHENLFNISSTSEESFASDIYIYPNPTSDFIRFSTPVEHLTIYNIDGQVLGAFKEQNIDISNLETGIYFISFETDKQKVIRKFTVL